MSTEVAGEKFYFSLDGDLDIIPAAFNIEKLIVDELTGGVFDRTSANQDGDLFFAPFGEQVRAGCTFYLGFGKESAIRLRLSALCVIFTKKT
ncbi:hypothetical protein [Methanosarcina horonobensis]|uniref:hypothetical protein n=1 Tax=Methanosarcina horonobensis TaxID=418008 RepID=UPI0022B8A6B9|nr:hypothetical protein [Methanosarcina horonobensis]